MKILRYKKMISTSLRYWKKNKQKKLSNRQEKNREERLIKNNNFKVQIRRMKNKMKKKNFNKNWKNKASQLIQCKIYFNLIYINNLKI